MKLSVFVPQSTTTTTCPGLIFLSGLTCNEDNFITKSGAIRKASELKMILICPDTSPRGLNIQGEEDDWDFGTGASFYVDATVEKYQNYQMYTYITQELPLLMQNTISLLDIDRISIFGHSMGGHGALMCALRNPGLYRSCSAFSPIVHPSDCPWGKKAFNGYLRNHSEWKQYDSTELAKEYQQGPVLNILIDQGLEDKFFKEEQLKTFDFVNACQENRLLNLECRFQRGYDHSYWFIQSFIDEHLEFHFAFLKNDK